MQKIITKTVDNKSIFGISIAMSSPSAKERFSSGNLTDQSKFFIASTTKLYITAIIMQLRSENKLRLEDAISTYLAPDIMERLHRYNGVDYSNRITVQHLLSHTSGLPDYFEEKPDNQESLKERLLSGRDQQWTFEEAIDITKQIPPHFPPGESSKAYYSDTNYQLLGKIIETIIDISISEALEQIIFRPLNLKNTYLYSDPNDQSVTPLYYKNHQLSIPLAMCSFGADGGIVSTAEEMMIFLQAFFNGKFFPQSYLPEMQQWKKMFFPLMLGLGMMRFKLPWIFSPFKPIPELIGHSGLSGAFAYYCPAKDMYMTGTVNQIDKPQHSYRLMVKLLNGI